ncbi:MAG: hypothetical protein QG657_1927 [Acidobacteriota bacterium]|nr:hypothetical protein [Acidobacteriota bacterium]
MFEKLFSNRLSELLSTRIDRLAPPPRRVPLPTVCTALTGIFGTFGSMFFSFGMIFVWVFGAHAHPIDEWRLGRSFASAPAIVETVSPTHSTINDVPVYEYRFRFNPGDGLPIYGTCYTTGSHWNQGERVVAHYLPDNPDVACLEGARVSEFPIWLVLVVMVCPATGLAFFILSLVLGWRKVKLLRCGEITGTISISSTPTSTTVNDVPVMKYSYEFRDRLGKVYNGVSRALPTDKIGDEVREPVLYLPDNPQQSMLVDALPLKFPLGVDEGGHWYHRGGFKPVLLFIVIWGFVLIHVGIGILKIFGIW